MEDDDVDDFLSAEEDLPPNKLEVLDVKKGAGRNPYDSL